MPRRPLFASPRPLSAPTPRSGLSVGRPYASDSFMGLLGKLSDAYTSVESDNRRLIDALKVAQELAPGDLAGHREDTNGVPRESSGFGSSEGRSDRLHEMPRFDLSGAVPQLQQQREQFVSVFAGEGDSLEPSGATLPASHNKDHRLSEALRTGLADNTANLNRDFTSCTMETNSPYRSISDVQRDAKVKDHDLRKKFTKIAERSKQQNRTIYNEIDVMIAERQVLSPRRHAQLVTCEEAMCAINSAVGRVNQNNNFSYESFKDLVLRDDLEDVVGLEVFDFVLAFRHAFEREEITKMVARFSHVGTKELKLPDIDVVHWGLVTDPLSFFLILSNSVVLAVSTDRDPDWPGWDFIELGFTSFFVCELSLKMCVNGVFDFFLGVDRGWNIADFIFVAFAVIDAVLVSVTQVGESDFQMFTLMRLVRLCRITRLVRLLRFKMFKELLLMIQGIVAGLRTLFWAIILLMSVIFCLGMLMRQTIGRWCENGKSDLCADEHLSKYGRYLLGTVPRACFTVFRCFTEGCASVDGTPLLVHIYENSWYGTMMVVVYMLIFLGITFGLFNLIMAVFVENTMESAKLDERKRRQMRHRESLIIARKLQRIVLRFSQANNPGDATFSTSSGLEGGRSSVNFLWWSRASNKEEGGPLGIQPANRTVQITRDMFRDAVSDPSMEALLEDLEVNVSDPMTLFDTLDADDSGSLDVSELIQGILKLRGTADKSDVIASLLSIRSMQKSMRLFEFKVVQSQKRLESKIKGLEEHVLCLHKPSSEHHCANASPRTPGREPV